MAATAVESLDTACWSLSPQADKTMGVASKSPAASMRVPSSGKVIIEEW